ncbi:MAG: FAD:protein FMN transferase [Acutalibacteraceae bacterium]
MKQNGSKKIIGITAAVLCAVIIIGIAAYDFYISSGKLSDTYIAMGTLVTTELNGVNSAEATADIKEEINGIEESCISWRENESDVGRINQNPNSDVSVSRQTAEWIADSLDICQKSNGAFDITVGNLSKLWNIGSDNAAVPKEADIENTIQNIGYNKVLVDDTTVKIGSGQSLDLGAVGKGIACDCAKDILKEYKIKSAVISVGGSVLLYGNKKFTVGIVDPDNDSDYMATIKVKNKFVSTSGDYERYFEQDGKRYHHLLDPTTGYPAENNLRSVTVICDSGLQSDALSTACFVMGYKKSLGLLNQFDAQAVFIFDDKTVAVTDGIKDSFELSGNGYKMAS